MAGAGIGGLAAGIALQRVGFEVTVLERSSTPREVGSGILIQPNGVRALEALGIRALPGSTLQGIELRTFSGRHLSDTPIGRFRERYGTELKVVPRSDLHSLLLETLGRDRVTAAAEVTGYEIGAGLVTVKVRDSTSLVADLLIGADGLRSAVRAQMLAWTTAALPQALPRPWKRPLWPAVARTFGKGLAGRARQEFGD